MLAAAMTHPIVLALAGRGSSGFSGGSGRSYSGGGYSGRSYGGGGGGFFFLPVGGGGGGLLFLIFLIVIAVVIARIVLPAIRNASEASRARATDRERRRREAAVLPSTLEAAEDDAAFDPDEVRAAAAGLVRDTQDAWDRDDRRALARLVGPDLLAEWTRRLDDFASRGWRSRAGVVGDPVVRIVGLTNRTEDEDDRVVVHVTADALSYVETRWGQRLYEAGQTDERVRLSQYWTLGKRDGRWILLSIEEDGEGDHHLEGEVVARADLDPTLADRARTEVAVAGAAAPAATLAELVPASLSDDARATALDLALVDDRFSPDVLTAAARRAVAAWTAAIDGADDELEAVATPEAVRALLYADAGADVRTVVRGPRVDEVVIERVRGDVAPPRIEVAVRHRARWYREDRDTQAVLEGSRTAETAREERWSFALTDDADVVWRLVGAR
ncbi:TIM44-like domain-containing protein [Patulibacter sp. S7RM1-6]